MARTGLAAVRPRHGDLPACRTDGRRHGIAGSIAQPICELDADTLTRRHGPTGRKSGPDACPAAESDANLDRVGRAARPKPMFAKVLIVLYGRKRAEPPPF
jgi:hypothetical protein